MTVSDVEQQLEIQRKEVLPVAETALGINIEVLQSGDRNDTTVMQQYLFTGLGIPHIKPEDSPHLLSLIMWSHALDDIVDIREAHIEVREALIAHPLIMEHREINTDGWYGLLEILEVPYASSFPKATRLKEFVTSVEAKIESQFGNENLQAFRSATLRLIIAGLIQTSIPSESKGQSTLMEVYDAYLAKEIPGIDKDFWELSPHTRIALASSLQNMFITSFRDLDSDEIHLIGIGDLLLGPLVFLANNKKEQEAGLSYPKQGESFINSPDFVSMIEIAIDSLVLNNWDQELLEGKFRQLRAGIHFLSGGLYGDTHAFASIEDDFHSASIIVDKYMELKSDLFAEI